MNETCACQPVLYTSFVHHEVDFFGSKGPLGGLAIEQFLLNLGHRLSCFDECLAYFSVSSSVTGRDKICNSTRFEECLEVWSGIIVLDELKQIYSSLPACYLGGFHESKTNNGSFRIISISETVSEASSTGYYVLNFLINWPKMNLPWELRKVRQYVHLRLHWFGNCRCGRAFSGGHHLPACVCILSRVCMTIWMKRIYQL